MRFVIAALLIFALNLPTQAEPLSSKLRKVWHKYIHTQATKGPRLARLTAYWPGDPQGGHYTSRRKSSTGVTLRQGHCAVDPRVIPYGSVVIIKGVGKFTAVDTGTAIVSRRAARLAGRTAQQRKALVIDLFFPSRAAAKRFTRNAPMFAMITWIPPKKRR
ncbi:MAG: 3D domain-containing protein [bacterium]